jgi:putative endonuclease
MTNTVKWTLYIGVTSNLLQRIYQHKNHTFEGFTAEHDLTVLVYYETHETMNQAILREKQMKKWKREWKIRLIEERNPKWHDLYWEIIESHPY